ncbi:MAG TPA: hypothetical protein VEX37_03495 [Thermomicrobiales bacterium]|nr:hypothetical protein [Thermomicrobiales bacterium]
MIDEELTWQRREISGETVQVCEKCGRPMSDALLRLSADETSADGGAGMRICPACFEAMASGTAPVELDDEDDLEPVR